MNSSEDEGSDSASESDQEALSSQDASESDSSGDESDDVLPPQKQSYAMLMETFKATETRPNKRRKTEHAENSPKEVQSPGREDSDDEEPNEAEEQLETMEDVDTVEDEEETRDASDPFTAHFADPDENELRKALAAIQDNEITIDRCDFASSMTAFVGRPGGTGPVGGSRLPTIADLSNLRLKEKLLNAAKREIPIHNGLYGSLAPLMFGYQDLLFTERTLVNGNTLTRLACLHALNHIFK